MWEKVTEKVTGFLLKYRYVVILVFAVLFALGVVGTVFLVTDDDKINSDMMSYLTDDFDTRTGLDFLREYFDIQGDATLVVRGGEDDEELRQAVERIKAFDGISQLIWVEDAYTLDGFKDSLGDFDLSEIDFDAENFEEILAEISSQNSAMAALISSMKIDSYVKLLKLADMEIDASALVDYMKRPVEGMDGTYDYVIMIMMEYAPSTADAYTLLDSIKAEFDGRSIASSGMTETAQTVMSDTLNDLPNFIIYAVLAVIVILILATASFIEPLIIIITLGVSIVISMGANYLYPSISIISFAISAVLQLAITMDYSIFYMHIYRKNRTSLNPYDATVKAVPEVSSSILASGLTTIGGFAALYCMRFGVGADIAGVIIKGVVLSLVTIIVLQPIITLLLDKAIVKTTHHFTDLINAKIKEKKPQFGGVSKEKVLRPVAKFSVWQRIALTVVAVALLAPAFIGQYSLNYSYFKMYEVVVDTPEKELAEELGNQMIMAVPLHTKTGTQSDFIAEVLADPNGKVSGVTGAFTSIDIDAEALEAMLDILTDPDEIERLETTIKSLPEYLENDFVKNLLDQYGIDLSGLDLEALQDLNISEMLADVDLSMLNSYFAKNEDGVWYTMYSVSISGSTEDDAAAATYEYLLAVRNKYFDEGYSIGMLTGSYDMRQVTPRDFLVVTLVSAAIILVIITILIRNPLKSLILVVLIELGIWINLSITFLLGQEINFMIYIIISSVQLGVTVDYAILLANTIEHNRDKFTSSKECAVQSATEAVPAIFVSALLIIAVCLSVYFVSQNLIIKQLTGMLARGAAISFILVTFVQTAVMSFFKTERRKTDFAGKLKAVEEKLKGGKEE